MLSKVVQPKLANGIVFSKFSSREKSFSSAGKLRKHDSVGQFGLDNF
jgi:hypothetical protein